METSRTVLYSGVRNTYSALLVPQASLPDNRPRDMQYDSASLVRQKRFPVILISRRLNPVLPQVLQGGHRRRLLYVLPNQ